MGEVLLFNKFFPIVDMCLSCEDIDQQSCATVPRWQIFGNFLRPVFSASRVQHVSDLQLKLALRPHHVCKYGRHQSSTAEIRRGKEKIEEETTGQKYNGLPYSTGRP